MEFNYDGYKPKTQFTILEDFMAAMDTYVEARITHREEIMCRELGLADKVDESQQNIFRAREDVIRQLGWAIEQSIEFHEEEKRNQCK